jgi:hypothetical protein
LQRDASIASFSSIILKLRLDAVRSARLNSSVRWLRQDKLSRQIFGFFFVFFDSYAAKHTGVKVIHKYMLLTLSTLRVILNNSNVNLSKNPIMTVISLFVENG